MPNRHKHLGYYKVYYEYTTVCGIVIKLTGPQCKLRQRLHHKTCEICKLAQNKKKN